LKRFKIKFDSANTANTTRVHVHMNIIITPPVLLVILLRLNFPILQQKT